MRDNVRTGTEQAVEAMHHGTDRVRDGVEKSTRISASMQDIQRDSELVLTSIEDISAALAKQSPASDQISQGIGHIAHLSENNAELAGETAQAAQALDSSPTR